MQWAAFHLFTDFYGIGLPARRSCRIFESGAYADSFAEFAPRKTVDIFVWPFSEQTKQRHAETAMLSTEAIDFHISIIAYRVDVTEPVGIWVGDTPKVTWTGQFFLTSG